MSPWKKRQILLIGEHVLPVESVRGLEQHCVGVTHQLLNDPLYQGGEGHAVILPVVKNVFDQLGDDLRIRLGLELVTLVDLERMRGTVQCFGSSSVNSQ